MKIIEHKENPFPTEEEGRLNSILNVVNNELKTVILLNLDNVPADGHELKRRVRQTVGNGVYLPVSSRNFEGYCHQTFYPIGTVAEETILKESGDATYWGYSLTEAGKKYGRPIAAFTLDYVVKSARSLYPILGSTSTPTGKKRAPLNRIQILDRLRRGNLRIKDLEREIKVSDTAIHNSLVQLAKSDLVYFDSVDEVERGKGQVCYEWVEGRKIEDIKPYYTDVALSRSLALLLKERGKITSSEAFSILGVNRKDIRAFTSILGHFVKEGVAKPVRWKGTQYSDARITEKGRIFLEEYVDKVRSALMDGTQLNMMEETYLDFINHPMKLKEYARSAIQMYKRISKRVSPVSKQKRNEQIIEFVRTHPGNRPIEIKQALGLSDVSHFLTPLVKSGALRKEKSDRDCRYFIN